MKKQTKTLLLGALFILITLSIMEESIFFCCVMTVVAMVLIPFKTNQG